jgi:hypothetical protein
MGIRVAFRRIPLSPGPPPRRGEGKTCTAYEKMRRNNVASWVGRSRACGTNEPGGRKKHRAEREDWNFGNETQVTRAQKPW